MWSVLPALALGDDSVLREMVESGNETFIPVLVELFRLPLGSESGEARAINAAIQDFAGGTDEWVGWLAGLTEVEPPPQFAPWKGALYSIIDPNIGAFFYPGVVSKIRLSEIVWGGVARDGIPDLRNPAHLSTEEAGYLEPSDRVFGVSINGEHRAYPLRILNAHEMANDVLGGEPFALAY